jgi:hypothetical protein
MLPASIAFFKEERQYLAALEEILFIELLGH